MSGGRRTANYYWRIRVQNGDRIWSRPLAISVRIKMNFVASVSNQWLATCNEKQKFVVQIVADGERCVCEENWVI